MLAGGRSCLVHHSENVHKKQKGGFFATVDNKVVAGIVILCLFLRSR